MSNPTRLLSAETLQLIEEIIPRCVAETIASLHKAGVLQVSPAYVAGNLNDPASRTEKRCEATSRSPELTSDTDLGCIVALSRYMHLPERYLRSVKKGAIIRAAQNPANRPCFTGTKSCKKWVMEWLERNPDFKTTEAG